MSSTRRHSHGATRSSRSAKKAALSTDGESATVSTLRSSGQGASCCCVWVYFDVLCVLSQEMGKTIFAGWTGELMQLQVGALSLYTDLNTQVWHRANYRVTVVICNFQNETLQLLHKVRPKRKKSHQHTIGKGWASGTPLPAEQQTAPRAGWLSKRS